MSQSPFCRATRTADALIACRDELRKALAKASGKDIQDVLDRKRINNRWHDVARELGVDARDLHLDDERYGYGYGRGPRCDFDDEAADE